jgi:type I restriction enzyme, R subunit
VRPDVIGSVRQLWNVHAAAEPESVKGEGGSALVDLVALVRHAIYPAEPVVPVRAEIEDAYSAWLNEQEKAGVTFTAEQKQWLDAIRDHIAESLAIEQIDFEDVPFNRMGGLGKVYQLFGDRLPKLLEELNERLAA